MPRVFLSYRRSDAAGHAGRLYDGLAARFGQERVFMDLDSIGPGSDWVERIEQAVDASDVMLAVIGRTWLTEANPGRTRRLEDPHDFVRKEVAAALERGLPVVPVLVAGATMPAVENLPADLAALARRHAFELSDTRWRSDVDRLLKVITEISDRNSPSEGHALEARAPDGASVRTVGTFPVSGSSQGQSERRSAVIRFTHLSNWGSAFRIAAPLGGAAAVAAILAAGVFSGSSHHPQHFLTVGSPPPPSTATPSAPNPASNVGGWPARTSAWTVVLAARLHRQAAVQVAARAFARARAGVLRSTDYSSLRPGQWLVFSGQYPTMQSAARAASVWRRQGFSRAHPAFVNGGALGK